MKKLTALAVAIVAALSVVGAALAITNGELDGNAHPNVGAFLVQRPTGWSVLCTGSLVAPRVFLTASHCTSFADEQGLTVGVTFQSTDSEHPATVLTGHTATNPLYHAPYAHDVSVIVLDQAQPGPYVPLPRVGLLDDLKKTNAQLQKTLDSVEGIGPARKRALLRHFGSVQAIREAPVEEIVKLGVPERLAKRLKETL